MPTTKVSITKEKLDDLANAIADKSGESIPMTLSQMISAVEGISGGGGYEDDIVQGTISGMYENSRVTQVGQYAFYHINGITGVSMPNVTTIGMQAFNSCMNLQTVYMPLLSSGNINAMYVFANCVNLSSVDFPHLSIVFPNMFNGCTGLREAHISNVTEIKSGAFSNCQSLSLIDAPNVTTIGLQAFQGCLSLTSFNAQNVSFIESSAFYNANLSLGVSMPSVTGIGAYAFKYTKLTTASFPEVVYLDGGAFGNCYSLTTVSFPKLKSLFLSQHFAYCSSLTSIYLPSLGTVGSSSAGGTYPVVTSASGVFTNCTSLSYFNFPIAFGGIGSTAFAGCINLISFNAPKINAVFNTAFSGCSKLREVYLPNLDPTYGYQSYVIMQSAFSGCASLSRIVMGITSTLASSLKSTGYLSSRCFSGCTALKNVYFLSGRFSIHAYTFVTCSLNGIYMLGSSLNIMLNGAPTSTMLGDMTNLSIYVPESQYASWCTATNWKSISSRFVSLTNSQIQDILTEITPVVPDPD